MSEAAGLEKEKEDVVETSKRSKERIAELVTKLEGLKRQVKPASKPEEDDFGRMPKDDMDVDYDRDREAGVQIKGEDGDVEVEY